MTLSFYPGETSVGEPANAFGELTFSTLLFSFRLDVIPVQTASTTVATLANLKQLPPARNGRFSLRDLVSVLDSSGREAFNHQGTLQDAQLRARHDRAEISSLYFYRCLARITQEQLAERAHSRQSFISQLEKRRRPLTWKQARKLAVTLGVQPAQLMEHT